MLPTNGTLLSNGAAGAVVIVLCWLLSLAKITVPNEVALALMALVSWVASHYIHDKPAEPAAPSAATKGFVKLDAVILLAAIGAIILLGGCAQLPPSVDALAKDPNTASLHAGAQGVWGHVSLDFARSGTAGTTASANDSTGAQINIPQPKAAGSP
jgi:hypothetical protein